MESPEIPESIQFLDTYTKSFILEFQRLAITLILLYFAAPKEIAAVFHEKFNPAFHEFIDAISEFLDLTKEDHPWRVLLIVFVVFVLIQLIIIVHRLALVFLNIWLPTMYVKIFRLDFSLDEQRKTIIKLVYKCYDNMSFDDFQLLFSMHYAKDLEEWNSKIKASNEEKPEMFSYIKERMFCFVLLLFWSRDFTDIWLGILVICVLVFISIWRASVNESKKQQSLVDVSTTTAIRLMASEMKNFKEPVVSGPHSTGVVPHAHVPLVIEARLWIFRVRIISSDSKKLPSIRFMRD
jgi:hypothetical protein